MRTDLDQLARMLGLTKASGLARPDPATRAPAADSNPNPMWTDRRDAPFDGPFAVIEKRWPAHHLQGVVPLRAFLDLPPDALRCVSGELQAPDLIPGAVGFLDCETTGLRAGPGSYAFLVGLGSFDADGYILRQYFLADPSGEPEMLRCLTQALDAFSVLVTFNGRSFDVPFLESRIALNRARPLSPFFHLDLLPGSRRLFRRRIGSCRLVRLESHVLDLHRVEDLPSSEVPAAYFQYVYDGDRRALDLVLEHNATDIVSLPSLAARVHGTIMGVSDWPEDLASAGALLAARGDRAAARTALEKALAAGLSGPARREAHRHLALMCRREGLRDGVEHHLSALVDLGTLDVRVFLALARLALARRDRDMAADHCRLGLRRLTTAAAVLGTTVNPSRDRLRAFLDRLERHVERQRRSTLPGPRGA